MSTKIKNIMQFNSRHVLQIFYSMNILREYDFALFRLKYISHGTVGWDCKDANYMTDK